MVASSLEEAVLSTIKGVEAASIAAKVPYVTTEDLVTETEITKRLKKKRQAISLWMQGARRGAIPFPKPVMKLSDRSPHWKWKEITEWLFSSNMITEKEVVTNAIFLEHVNAALEERDVYVFKIRQKLIMKLNKPTRAQHHN